MRKATKKSASIDLYQVITNRVIEQLEKGVLPWRKTWSSYGAARNYVSGKPYRGINALLMTFCSPHPIPYYLTFNQAKELGAKVKKGSKSQQVVYFNMVFKDKNGHKLTREAAQQLEGVQVIKFLKYFNVFNVEDIEGVDFDIPEVQLKPNERIERCEQLVEGYVSPPSYQEADRSRAYYSPSQDLVNMPPIEQHENSEYYYSTFFHELVHSTGHSSRLDREEVSTPHRFGSEPYSREELVAELGSSFLRTIAGIDSDPLFQNSSAYINSWLQRLKSDKQLIFKASAEAQKAVDYIAGSTFENAN